VKRVDCPHCGAQLDPALVEAQAQVQCAQCGRQLRLMRKRDLRPAKGEATPTPDGEPARPPEKKPPTLAPALPEPKPRPVGGRPESLLPPPPRVPIPGRPAEESEEAPIELAPSIALESRPSVPTDNLLEELSNRKARTRVRMSAALVAFTAVSLAAILWLVNTNPKKETAASDEIQAAGAKAELQDNAALKTEQQKQAPPAEDNSVEEKSVDGNSPAAGESGEEEKAVAPQPPVEKPIAWGELDSVGRRDLEKLWAQLHPYVFRLVVKKSDSERTISGLLLDSRGYLVTSLAAIEGATSIVAAPAPSDPLSELAADALKDEVRGVLAVDRAHDLALLQINRRLVNVVSGLQPSDKLLVPGRALIQAAAIGPERFGWLTESKIKASTPEKFPASLQQQIERRELDLGPYWPQHQLQLSCGAGAGLFTEDGRLAGVNTGIKHEGGQFISEAKLVFELLKQAKEPAGPLSALSKLSKPATANAEASTTSEQSPAAAVANTGPGASPFPAGHEADPLAKRLADAAFACEAFGWLPGEEGTQPAALPAALIAWREARELLRARRLFPDDSKLFSKQVTHWTGRINATLLSLDREQSAELNRKAWASLQGESAQTLVLFVRVALQPGTSPRLAGVDTATFQLLGTDQYLIAEVEPNAAPLLPDSEWLVVATIDPSEELLVNPQPDKQANARKAKECKEISEVKSIGFRVDPLKANPGKQDKQTDQ
jgi:hypothetical protein